jgi:hypothetical protein
MKPCKVCGKAVSPNVATCPVCLAEWPVVDRPTESLIGDHCGEPEPVPAPEPVPVEPLSWGCLFFIIMAGFLVRCFS